MQAGTIQTVRQARSDAFSSSSKKTLKRGKRKDPMTNWVTPAPCQVSQRTCPECIRQQCRSKYQNAFPNAYIPSYPIRRPLRTGKLHAKGLDCIQKTEHPSCAVHPPIQLTGVCSSDHFLAKHSTGPVLAHDKGTPRHTNESTQGIKIRGRPD